MNRTAVKVAKVVGKGALNFGKEVAAYCIADAIVTGAFNATEAGIKKIKEKVKESKKVKTIEVIAE